MAQVWFFQILLIFKGLVPAVAAADFQMRIVITALLISKWDLETRKTTYYDQNNYAFQRPCFPTNYVHTNGGFSVRKAYNPQAW